MTSDGQEGSNFRFYDNRQKYLMFVNTCSEKWVVAQRVAKELETLAPKPPALLIRLISTSSDKSAMVVASQRWRSRWKMPVISVIDGLGILCPYLRFFVS